MKPSVCLCMIVKNEAAVVERCLDSVKGLVDTWVISDTGSTDDTRKIIRSALRTVPGELHEERWTDFGHNRTLNIRHAAGKADYLLLIDADHELRQDGPLPELSADSYMLRHEGATEYRIKRLVRGDIPWRYQGATHEYLTSDREHGAEHLDALVVVDHADGGSRTDKFERDARLLSARLRGDPDDARTVFYLAQTMQDLGDPAEAVALYERRAEMGGWDEEVYVALLRAGILRAETDRWPAACDLFARAWELRPDRLEACYEWGSRLRGRGLYQAAHAVVKAGVGRAQPDDLLFVQPWVYRWGLLFEFSVTAYWVGDCAGSLRACDELLSMPDLPAAYRAQTVANRTFAASRTAAVPQPVRRARRHPARR